MTSPAILAFLYLLAFFLVLKRRRITRSNSVEPLTVRTITPEKVDAVASVMAEPLRAPVQSFDISVGAQKLSISDSDVDALISTFSSFLLKDRLPRSCLKRNLRSPSHPCVRKQVHFNTHPEYPDIDVSGLVLFEISPRKEPPKRRTTPPNITPHIPGSRYIRPYTDGRLELLKAVGTFKPPGPPLTFRPRCQVLRHFGCCELCFRPPVQSNVWLVDSRLDDSCPARNPDNDNRQWFS